MVEGVGPPTLIRTHHTETQVDGLLSVMTTLTMAKVSLPMRLPTCWGGHTPGPVIQEAVRIRRQINGV